MAVPQYRDEVLVTLESVDPSSDFAFPDRRFFLSKEKPTIAIGRTSKRNSSFEAAKNNAWFDSAVMSRTHAELKLDVDKQKVYIKDTGSLHGTFKNDQRLLRACFSILATGDLVRFGIPIDRGMERYPPCTMKARLQFGTIDPENRTKIFSVPDDTDVDYSDSESDHQVRDSCEVLHTMKVFPAAFPASSPSESPIDLTSMDQYPLSNVRNEVDHTASVSSNAKPDSGMARIPTSSSVPVPEDPEFDAPASPHDPWSFSDSENINLTQSTDMDTDSFPETESEGDTDGYLYGPASTMEDEDQDSDEMSEQDFEERDEFEDEEYNCDDPLDEEDGPAWGFSQPVITPSEPSALDSFSEEPRAAPVEVPRQNQSQPDTREIVNSPMSRVNYLLNPYPVPISPRNLVHPRLPSISETIPTDPFPPRPCHGGLSAAEIMGIKTGKPEFFAAREANKAGSQSMAGSSQPPAPRLTTLLFPESPSVSFPDFRRPHRKHGLDIVLHPVPTCSKRKKEAHNNDTSEGLQLVESDLAKSGAEFLNTPPQEPEVPCSAEDPVLDESSAYEYAMSKKDNDSAVDSDSAVVADDPAATADAMEDVEGPLGTDTAEMEGEESLATQVIVKVNDKEVVVKKVDDKKVDDKEVDDKEIGDKEISDKEIDDTVAFLVDVVGESAHNVDHVESDLPEDPLSLAETPRSSKRKAEEISQLTPEEERHTEVLDRARRRFRGRANKARAVVSEPVARPPSKRLRRVAEVVGYAALGGVAVMSALIATAPTL